ncbi:unnamed protein product [Amoebophrya sp. A25]|nr:unnamed protein product [Amoebophrya sp. A25]|eukprot:GSA25T00025761001.1
MTKALSFSSLQNQEGGKMNSSSSPGAVSGTMAGAGGELTPVVSSSQIVVTPRSTVSDALELLHQVASHPLTPPVRETLSRLIKTLRHIQQSIKTAAKLDQLQSTRTNSSAASNASSGSSSDATTAPGTSNPENGAMITNTTTATATSTSTAKIISRSHSAPNMSSLPREKLRDLYDEACSQAGTLRFEIAMSYKDTPEMRDLLVSKVQQCHDLLKQMYKALCDRLSVQMALDGLRDMKDTAVGVAISCRTTFLNLCEQVIEILDSMATQVPDHIKTTGYSVLKRLHDSALEALLRLKELLCGETGLAITLRRRFLHQIEQALEYLHAVKDRLIKSQSLSLALDTLDDIERNAEALCLVGCDRLDSFYGESTQGVVSSDKHGAGKGLDLVRESTNRVQAELRRLKEQFVKEKLAATRTKIRDFQQEMLIVNDQNIAKLQQKYEDCFNALQQLTTAEFLEFPQDALLPEQILLLRKKISMVGDYLQDTVTRNHLTSTLITSSMQYMRSLVNLRKACGMLSQYGESIKSLVPFHEEIGFLLEEASERVSRLLLFEKIRGLLPVEFVSQMLKEAFESVNNLRIAIQAAVTTAVTTVVATGKNAADGVHSAAVETQRRMVAILTRICSLILNAQRDAVYGMYQLGLDSVIFADRILGVVQFAEAVVSKARSVNTLNSVLEGSTKKALALDRFITGGAARDLLENAIEDYQIRGGRIHSTSMV